MFSIGITRLSKLRSYKSAFDLGSAVESYNGVLAAMQNQGSSIEMVRKTLAALAFYYQFDALTLWQMSEEDSTLNCMFVHAAYDLSDQFKRSLNNPQTSSRKDAIARVFERQQSMLLDTNRFLAPLAEQMRTALLLPITCDDKPIGVLEIFVKEKYDFNSTVKTFLQNIATQMGDKLYRRQLEHNRLNDQRAHESKAASQKTEDGSAEKGRALIALMAHDIKAPICASRLLIELLQKGRVGALTEPQRSLIDLIEFNTTEVLRLIKEALYSQRFSAEEKSPVDLANVLESCSGDLKQELEGKEIKLIKSVSTAQPVVDGDALAIKHVLLNILHNAIKFSGDGSSIEACVHEGENNSIVVTIKDNGKGMTTEQQARLFKPFSKSDGGQSLSDGDGLGLYLSRLIMVQHGGDIKVASEPAKGSTFSATFPKSQVLKMAS